MLRQPPVGLANRARMALDLYPCDLLFVHRDSEGQDRALRIREIERHLAGGVPVPFVPLIPCRMQEAWFMCHEPSLREAAGNPNGRFALDIPAFRRLEHLPNPKADLEALLRKASGLRGRRLDQFRVGPAKHRLATLIPDFAPLRQLPAFLALEDDIATVVREQGWN
jgi:hypothetical protein